MNNKGLIIVMRKRKSSIKFNLKYLKLTTTVKEFNQMK